MKDPTPQISGAEWQVMKFIWKQEAPCTAQTVIESLAEPNEWSPATIKTLLNRLVQKKALNFEKEGKAYLYSAAFSETACQTTETDAFLNRVFDGGLSPLIAHFAQARGLSKKDIKELEDLLRESRKPR
jgi:BlaI family transcriptional regulator, penicillinase repressor